MDVVRLTCQARSECESEEAGNCRDHERRCPQGKSLYSDCLPSINNPDKVSQATRNRVEKAAREVGYLPQPMGRNVKRNESRTILVIVRISAIPSLAKLFAVSKLRRQITDIWC